MCTYIFPNQIHVGFNDRDVSECEDFMSIIEQLEPGKPGNKMARKKCEEDIKPDIDVIQAVVPLPVKPGMARAQYGPRRVIMVSFALTASLIA